MVDIEESARDERGCGVMETPVASSGNWWSHSVFDLSLSDIDGRQ